MYDEEDWIAKQAVRFGVGIVLLLLIAGLLIALGFLFWTPHKHPNQDK